MPSRWLYILGAGLLWSASLAAQSNVASGELHGSVTDPSGTAVPGAKVTVKSDITGLIRTDTTDLSGEYRFLQLPPGDYDVQIEKEGFRTGIAKSVRVTVGQVAILDNRLELGIPTQVVEVMAETSLVENERSHQANTLEREAIENLPINRRDYLTFTLLAPGVVDTSALADGLDFRVHQTPNSGLSFYGSNGRGNSVTVDGGEANDAGGGVRSTITQEAVQEFQINRSNYSAELGGATGGVINIVSKTGTNEVHGTLFGFFRHESLDAGNPFARVLRDDGRLVRTKPPSQRQQFGGSIGLPLKKDQTFLFAGAEGLVRDESSVVTVFTDPSIFGPTPAQQVVLSALPPAVAVPLRAALTSPPETVQMFQRNSGVFPFTTRNARFSVRIDHRAGDHDQLFFRHNYSRLRETNATLQALVGASRGNEDKTFDPTTILGWTHQFNQRLINEARFQWNYRNFSVNSLEKFGPEFRIAGFGVFNRDLLLPSINIERRYEIRDSLSYYRGAHVWKFGAQVLIRGVHSESHVFFPGRFEFGELPGALLNPALPSTFVVNGLQAFNLGLAQTYLQGFGNPTVASTNPYYGFFVQDSWKVRPNLTLDFGLRYELDTRQPPLPTDTNNVAPRFAFAWDPFNNKKTTVRGGYGIFYSPVYYQVDWVVNALNQINGRRQIAQVFTTILDQGPANAANVFTTLRAKGVIGVPTPTRSLTEADLAPFGITFPHTGPLSPFTLLFENSPDYVSPYAQQASLAIEREVVPNLSVSVGYTYVRTLKIPRARDKNLLAAPVDPRLGIRVWSNPLRDFANPFIGQFNVFESTARAFYSGMVVEVKKRFSHSFSVNGNYTFSRATDEVVDYNTPFEANDQTNLRAERALSSFDQRHKLVAYALWNAPARFQVAPIFRANSGRPFNLLVGSDLNGDRHSDTDRPPFAGRNTGQGPNFWTFDLRLGHKIKFGESRHIELMAEAFNLFNRLNFASINNTVGNRSGPFNLRGRNDKTPSEPLGFTAAYDPRRVQLGVRFNF
ncbi:MAG: TonB-dependent receptor [Acidobacteria bacterium]|nr:TonB-dependent receptor [Acidobacteriota bacterium]